MLASTCLYSLYAWSWICDASVWTTHEEYLVVFIAVQNFGWNRRCSFQDIGKEEYLYSDFSHQGTYKALRHGSHSFTCKQHHACLRQEWYFEHI